MGLVALALLAVAPSRVVAQAPRAAPPFPTVVEWPAGSEPAGQAGPNRSAAGTIAIHGAVGTGAGLLIGLVLSGSSMSDDRATVVVTWAALGAAAGVVSGVVTWLARPL
jgi:hypothetical protein